MAVAPFDRPPDDEAWHANGQPRIRPGGQAKGRHRPVGSSAGRSFISGLVNCVCPELVGPSPEALVINTGN
jgi:hypothetical protein